jgi:hypothetical protein
VKGVQSQGLPVLERHVHKEKGFVGNKSPRWEGNGYGYK